MMKRRYKKLIHKNPSLQFELQTTQNVVNKRQGRFAEGNQIVDVQPYLTHWYRSKTMQFSSLSRLNDGVFWKLV